MKSILFSLFLFILVILAGCTGGQSASGEWDSGYHAGYDSGYKVGYFEAFSKGCQEGYKMGRSEASRGLPSSMDWFFDKYPQYR